MSDKPASLTVMFTDRSDDPVPDPVPPKPKRTRKAKPPPAPVLQVAPEPDPPAAAPADPVPETVTQQAKDETGPAGTLAAAVQLSVAAMTWLTEADKATIALCRSYAEQIEGGGEDGGKAMYLGPHLLRALGELGGTPAGRKALDIKDPTQGKLAQLRAVRTGERGDPRTA